VRSEEHSDEWSQGTIEYMDEEHSDEYMDDRETIQYEERSDDIILEQSQKKAKPSPKAHLLVKK
jgi:hypothetical protein